MKIDLLKVLESFPLRSTYEVDTEYAYAVEKWLVDMIPFQQSQNVAITQTNEVYADISVKQQAIEALYNLIEQMHQEGIEAKEQIEALNAIIQSTKEDVLIETEKTTEYIDALRKNFIDDEVEESLITTFSAKKLHMAISGVIPTGSVFYIVGKKVPSGFLECDGSVLDRKLYATLWNYVLTSEAYCNEENWLNNNFGLFSTGDGENTFRLPDLRGVHLRAWDNGRGMDVQRSFGSYQADDIKEHTHYLYAQNHSTNSRWAWGAVHAQDYTSIKKTYLSEPACEAENRVKNIALMAIIKY